MATLPSSEDLNQKCLKDPHDISLKLCTISSSLEDLRKIYSTTLDQDADAKVNERFFDAFFGQFPELNKSPMDLIQKLEAIRLALEPEGYGINFISAYKKLSDQEKERLSQNQSSSPAIINYLSARLGLNSKQGFKFLKRLSLYKGIHSFVAIVFIFSCIGFSFFIWVWTLEKVIPRLETILPDWGIGITVLLSVIILPIILFITFFKAGEYVGQSVDKFLIDSLKKYYQNQSNEQED